MTTFRFSVKNGVLQYTRKTNINPSKIRDIRIFKRGDNNNFQGLIVAPNKFKAACLIP